MFPEIKHNNVSQNIFSKYLTKSFMKYYTVTYHRMFHFISWNIL